jgi:hypothetical protein
MDYFSAEAPAPASPSVKRPGNAMHAKLRRTVSTFTMAAQAAGSRLMLPRVAAGARGVHHRITASVSLGAATAAIGIAGNTGKYRAAAVLTAVETPELVAHTANLAAELAADEDQFVTIAAAALPGAGTLVVETFYTDYN